MKTTILILFCALAVSAQTFNNGVTIKQVKAGLTVLSNELATLEAEQKSIAKENSDFEKSLDFQVQAGQITLTQKIKLHLDHVEVFRQNAEVINQQIATVQLQIINIHRMYNVP